MINSKYAYKVHNYKIPVDLFNPHLNWTITDSFCTITIHISCWFICIEYVFGQYDITVQFKMYTSYVYMTRKHSSDLIKH